MRTSKVIAVFVSILMIVGLALAMMPAVEVHAAIVEVVDNTNDSGAGSLRQAIADVDDGGTITFDIPLPASITLTSGELIVVNKDLTITGPGAANLTISGIDAGRVFHNAGSGNVVAISGVTITNGAAANGPSGSPSGSGYGGDGSHGGGIYNKGTLTLNEVIVVGNHAGFGGNGYDSYGGDGGNGGGIYNEGTLTLISSTVSGNWTGFGGSGGMGDDGGDGGHGGGIYNIGTVMLNNSTVSGNHTGHGGNGSSFDSGGSGGDGGLGGGMYNEGMLTLDTSTVSANWTGYGGSGGDGGTAGGSGMSGGSGGDGGHGGGIYNVDTLTLTNSTVGDNWTGYGGNGGVGDKGGYGGRGGSGGGICSMSGDVTLTSSTVSGNWTGYGGSGGSGTSSGGTGGAGGHGGGIANEAYEGPGTLKLTNSTVSGNETGNGGHDAGGSARPGGYGGGILNGEGTVVLNNCTVSGNTTGDGNAYGGGIYNDSKATVDVKSTIIAGNTAEQGPDFFSGEDSTLTSHGCNLIEDTTGCTIEGNTTGNITGQDPSLGPLADNGGPTHTHALLPGSPAIDAVILCDCTTVAGVSVDEDQRGEPRPVDGDGAEYCDIGAYERVFAPMSVGGAVEPVDLSQLGATGDQLSGDNNSHGWLGLWAGLAFVLAIGGGGFVLRRRREH